jgi:3'-phosphoadenosine 5'-phosphosulfate (PAPS) 3'-phosphatase
MFIEYLFAGNKFHDIVGEEDDSVVNIMETPYTVDELVVPEEFEDLIGTTLEKIKALASRIDQTAYSDMTIFVDPIDGTREFATGKGDKVTILVGYNDAEGVPQAGIVYRPLTSPATWASGAKSEGFTDGVLDLPEKPNPKGVLITDGKVSPFLRATIENSGMNMVPSLASGNRVLMLVEGKAGAYIRDTGGFAKWDTSGPQAVLEAYGGVMAKLPAFLEDKTMISQKVGPEFGLLQAVGGSDSFECPGQVYVYSWFGFDCDGCASGQGVQLCAGSRGAGANQDGGVLHECHSQCNEQYQEGFSSHVYLKLLSHRLIIIS